MFHLMEPLFDIAYLGLVIGLGLRLVLEKDGGAHRYGWMAILLGGGDAFHLIPRVLAHLTPDGFSRYLPLLSWGEFVTSITMTVFYVLFYDYYRDRSGDSSRSKAQLVYGLAALRILMVLLPQNGWGGEGSYLFGILRNLPFAVLGLLLIVWCWQKRETAGLKYAGFLIFLSFLFYLPVVVGARFVPILGALMIPKTLAYVFLVLVGYRFYIRDFKADNLLKAAISFLILGLVGGVFYRELTKSLHFLGITTLAFVHVHMLVLGFLFLLLLYALLHDRTNESMAAVRKPFLLFGTGLVWTVDTLVVRGISQVTAPGALLYPDAALSGIAGIGHIFLGIGLVWLLLAFLRHQEIEA